MESWDDENFEPKVVAPAVVISNKWDGEDEDDDVKDNWEDEDEEVKQEEPPKEIIPPKPKKKLAERIAEKEKLKREQLEKKSKQMNDEDDDEEEEISPMERLRRQKESDLKMALETTFGEGESNSNIGLDIMNPTTKEEFQEFADAIVSKVQPFSKNAEFPVFAENLIRNICATMSSLDIKKIKNTVDNLYLEKQKIEKGDKAKKNKGKGKAKLKLDNDNQFTAYVEDYEEFDDFM